MILGRVIGTVVSTRKSPRLDGRKFLLVEKINPSTMKGKKDFVVAIDAVGAGPDEIVFYATGSCGRYTEATEGRPSHHRQQHPSAHQEVETASRH